MLRPKPVLPNPGIMVFISGKSSPNGRKIQVSEILWFTQIYPKMTKIENPLKTGEEILPTSTFIYN
jgi:hypothetical protein